MLRARAMPLYVGCSLLHLLMPHFLLLIPFGLLCAPLTVARCVLAIQDLLGFDPFLRSLARRGLLNHSFHICLTSFMAATLRPVNLWRMWEGLGPLGLMLGRLGILWPSVEWLG